jgi:hypothetical protein
VNLTKQSSHRPLIFGIKRETNKSIHMACTVFQGSVKKIV